MTEQNPAIYGSGGGGQQQTVVAAQQQPTVKKDNLQSKAYARILDLISEGEIGGLVDGDKSIYLDNTPLRAADGSLNFLNVKTDTRLGTNDQEYISGFTSTESEKGVNVTVVANNALEGTWSRDWKDATWQRAGNTIAVTWVDHGVSTNDEVFLNFADYGGSKIDKLYTATYFNDDQFTVQRGTTKLKKTSGQVYAIKPWLRIDVGTRDGSDWATGDQVYIRFLKQSSDPSKKQSSIFKQKSFNAVYNVIPAEDKDGSPSSSYFYVNWTDKAGSLANAQVDGGQVRVADATYTYNASTDVLTVNADNHGYSVGMTVELNPVTGPLKTIQKTYEIQTASTNSFTVSQGGNYSSTGSGTYYIEVPTTSGAITRQITNTEVDRVRLNIAVGALQKTTTAGNVTGSKFQYALDLQFNGGGFFAATIDGKQFEEIKGKTSGGFAFSREISFADQTGWDSGTVSNNFPIDMRLRRVNEDSDVQTNLNAFTWQSYTEITDAKLRYPNSALVGIEIDASQFSNIPTRSYHIKGIKIRIPNNATVDADTGALTYSGVWDGQFGSAQWCSDPAWVLYDLLVSRRYGFGEQILTDAEKTALDSGSWDGIASRLDRWSFFAASKYANELVDTGLPANEPQTEARFSCNVNIQSRQEAFTAINQLLSVFRTQAYWSNGSVVLAQDRPHDASYVFGASNVIDGNFSYSGSDVKTRPTIVLVRYFDEDIRDIATEVVEDTDLIAKYGVVTEEIDAFACNSQSQAARVGRWLLYTNAYETETVSFSIGIDSGVVLRPGMIINVSDPTRAATRLSGRVSYATASAITIDVDRTISAGDSFSVVLPDGILETRTVTAYVSATRTVGVSPAFSVAPNQNSPWLLTSSTVSPTTWRVISVAEDSENGVYGVTALAYNSGKFDYVESGAALQVSNISAIGALPAAPANITHTENMYADNGKAFVMVSVAWSPSEGAVSYKLRYRVNDGNWSPLIETATSQLDFPNAPDGEWDIEIMAFSVLGKKSDVATSTFFIIGKSAVPEDVESLEINQVDTKTAQPNWPQATDLDVLLGGKVVIRHSPQTSGVVWNNTYDIIPAVAGSVTQATVPLLAGTYMAKFEDSSGNRSTNAIAVTVTLPAPQSELLVLTFDEDATTPPFDGDLSNMVYSPDQDAIILDQGLFWDQLAIDGDFDALESIDQTGDIVAEGEYEFSQILDLGAVFDADIKADFESYGYFPTDLWDLITDVDALTSIDANVADKVTATLYVQTTNDDPTADDPEYTEWEPFFNGTRQGRGFNLKVVATSADSTQNIAIPVLQAQVTMQTRTEQDNDVTAVGSYSVTFANGFYQTPSIGISAQDMQTGDFYTLTSISKTGFTINFYQSGGTQMTRTFDWQAVGYGKQLA